MWKDGEWVIERVGGIDDGAGFISFAFLYTRDCAPTYHTTTQDHIFVFTYLIYCVRTTASKRAFQSEIEI